MAYQQFVPLPNLNFQMNRVLSNGPEGCREEELWEIAPQLQEFSGQTWYQQWHMLALRAEGDGRLMHAAYYHRMSEFFLPDSVPEKNTTYRDFQRCFYQAVGPDSLERARVPFRGSELPIIRLRAAREKGVVLVHGGFDSFIEEFYLAARSLVRRGYTVILFEGPGQGGALRGGLKMDHRWEKPVSAVLDHFGLDEVSLVGISLGGYLALRAAAHDQRIARVVAFDVVWDALEAMANKFHPELHELVTSGQAREVNALIAEMRQGNDMVDWMMSHGMYITGGADPFGYLERFARFTTRWISPLIRQDVLLLAGENDHFVPAEFYELQKQALTGARSLRGRFYPDGEPGSQHCQIDALDQAWDEIIQWLDRFHQAG